MQEKLKAFERLLVIMDELRENCPWDKKQTLESLRHLTIEETYEMADAITAQDYQSLKGELGDESRRLTAETAAASGRLADHQVEACSAVLNIEICQRAAAN